MYNQQGFQSSFAGQGTAGSQFRGTTGQFQPVGLVQSQYNPSSASRSFGTGISQQFGGSQFSGFQNQEAFHASNYRGNQPGHDAYLRSDSSNPAQSGFGASSYRASSFGSSGIGATGFGASNFGASQQFGQSQFANPQSYHTANYRGDQPGHDSYLRSDSSNPAQSGFGVSGASFGNQFGTSFSSSVQPSFGGSQQQQFSQFSNPQSYHLANYRGNQPGHDAQLRADSTQPAQSGFGGGAASSFGSATSSYGFSGNYQA